MNPSRHAKGPAAQAWLWVPVALWMAVLFAASAQSDIGIAGRIPDWLTHGSAYLFLGVLMGRALAGGLDGSLSAPRAVLAVVLCTLYGVTDEIHQSRVPGRDASIADVAKDFGGAAVGVAMLRGLAPVLRRPAQEEPLA